MPPGYDPNTDLADAVRFLVGDTTEPYQLADIEVQFALAQTNNSIYPAAAMCARALAARYARRVDTRFESVESSYGQLARNFSMLARKLEAQAKKVGGMGLPLAGGLTISERNAVNADTDRRKPFFYDGMMNNPPPLNE